MNKKEFNKEVQRDLVSLGFKLNNKDTEDIVETVFNVLRKNIVAGKTVTVDRIGKVSSSLRTYKDKLGVTKNPGGTYQRFTLKFGFFLGLKNDLNEFLKQK